MIRIKAHITFLLICLCGLLEAQENVQLKEVKVTRDRSLMRPQDLYGNAEAMPPHIGNVFQLDIFKDQIGQEVWYTQSQCLTVRQEVDLMPGGESGMYLEWNKLRPDCGVDNNWFGLANTVAPVLRLRVCMRVPITIKQDTSVCSCEIDS